MELPSGFGGRCQSDPSQQDATVAVSFAPDLRSSTRHMTRSRAGAALIEPCGKGKWLVRLWMELRDWIRGPGNA